MLLFSSVARGPDTLRAGPGRAGPGRARPPDAGGLTCCLCRLRAGPSEAPQWGWRGPSCWSCSTPSK